jgi:uncharacterized protein
VLVRIENSFEVPARVDRVWPFLLDIERVVPCMPGAELSETVDEDNYKGQLTLKLGAVKLTFAGKVTVAERDESNHKVVLKATGTEKRGKGAASGVITSVLEESGGPGTRVTVTQDLQVSGQAAQYSRGMMQDVSAKLTRQFADCLKANIEAAQTVPPSAGGEQPSPGTAAASGPGVTAAKEIQGLRLGLYALRRAILRFFKRLIGRKPAG